MSLDVNKVHADLIKSSKIEDVDIKAAVYLAGALEYMYAEFLEIAGNIAHSKKYCVIDPSIIEQVIKEDEEYNKLLGHLLVIENNELIKNPLPNLIPSKLVYEDPVETKTEID